MDKITIVFTSCGRFNLLKKTIKSFIQNNTFPFEKIIIIENSGFYESNYEIQKICDELDIDKSKIFLIINETNIGQVASIDKAYKYVDSDYIFHCEDDWEFFRKGFIEKSLDVLKTDNKILNVNLRVRFDGEKGSMHPLEPYTKKTNNGIIYFEYQTNYLNEWHGFSWNPGLRRLIDYKKIGNYYNYINEQGVGKFYYELGYKSACLEYFYCKHIGQNSITLKSNM